VDAPDEAANCRAGNAEPARDRSARLACRVVSPNLVYFGVRQAPHALNQHFHVNPYHRAPLEVAVPIVVSMCAEEEM